MPFIKYQRSNSAETLGSHENALSQAINISADRPSSANSIVQPSKAETIKTQKSIAFDEPQRAPKMLAQRTISPGGHIYLSPNTSISTMGSTYRSTQIPKKCTLSTDHRYIIDVYNPSPTEWIDSSDDEEIVRPILPVVPNLFRVFKDQSSGEATDENTMPIILNATRFRYETTPDLVHLTDGSLQIKKKSVFYDRSSYTHTATTAFGCGETQKVLLPQMAALDTEAMDANISCQGVGGGLDAYSIELDAQDYSAQMSAALSKFKLK